MEQRIEEMMRQINSGAKVKKQIKNQTENQEYRKIKEQLETLTAHIKKRLGQEHKLLNRLEELEDQLHGFETEWIYQQGICDCVTLLKWMGAFSNNII